MYRMNRRRKGEGGREGGREGRNRNNGWMCSCKLKRERESTRGKRRGGGQHPSPTIKAWTRK